MRFQDIYAYSDEIDRDKLVELIDLSMVVDWNPNSAGMQELLLGEFARREPTEALNKTFRFPRSRWTKLISIVFAEWSYLDLGEAMSAAALLKDEQMRIAFQTIVAERDDIPESAISDIAVSLGIESVVMEHVRHSSILRKLNKPRVAWDLALQGNVFDQDQSTLLVRIAETWKNEEGWEILNHLFDSLYQNNYSLFNELLVSIAANEPNEAYQFALQMPEEKRKIVLPKLLRVWAKEDPLSAFQASSQIVRISIRKSAQEEILGVWAAKNPIGFLDNIHTLPRNLLRKGWDIAIRELARVAPETASERIEEMRVQLGTVPVDTELGLVDQWATDDAESAVEWVNHNSEKGSQKRARMMQRVVSRHALVNAEKAIQLALAEEPHEFHSMVGLESYVIEAMVSHGKVDQARTLLDQVRESARPMAFSYVGSSFLESDRVDAVVDLALQLPEEEQSNYFYILSYSWLKRNPREFLDTVAKLPSSATKADLAQSLQQDQGRLDDALTNEQMEILQSFIAGTKADSPK